MQEIRLVIDYENGFQSGVLSKHYGVSDTTVRNILKSHGIIPYNGNKKTGDFLKENICISYIDGMSTREVGSMYGIDNSTVLKILIENEIQRREKRHPFALEEEQRMEAAIQYEDGKTLRDIATEFCVSTSTVKKALNEFNVPSRTGWGKFKTEPWLDRKGNEHVFKSRWELSYAKHLDVQNLDWEYELKKFILDGYIYTPDFRVQMEHGVEYHEVKGWLDARTIRRIKAFVSKYPKETLRIIGPAEMVALGLAEEYYLNHKMADEVSSLRHQIEGDNHGQNNC